MRFRGHASSDGVSCTAVLEAARHAAQLLEPTLVQITADGITLANAADANAPLEVYAAPSDIRSIIDAAADLPLDGGGAFAVRAAAIRFYATGTRLPAFLLTASDVCLDGRQGTTALTCSLTRLDAYDAASHNYRCVLQKPVNVCAQMTDGTLRVALGDLGLSVDNATVASISRILAAREASDTPPLQVRNETGAALLVDGVSVEANATATLSVDASRADRLGRARDGAPRAAQYWPTPTPRRWRWTGAPSMGQATVCGPLVPSPRATSSSVSTPIRTARRRAAADANPRREPVRPRDGAAGRW